MSDLIASNKHEYVELAIELGMRPEKINKLKKRLKVSLAKSSLFDSLNFTKNLEDLYSKLLNN